MYFSFLDTPSNNTRLAPLDESYECQIIISWPFRPGFLGEEEPTEVPKGNDERVALVKRIAAGWAEPFRECVLSIPEDTEVKTIKIEDWVPKRGAWDGQGKATLVGDAAHAMTMYRGEAANHGILDVEVLLGHLCPVSNDSGTDGRAQGDGKGLGGAIEAYEEEMIRRTAPAVLTSRRACLDAHNYERIGEESPLVNKRVRATEE